MRTIFEVVLVGAVIYLLWAMGKGGAGAGSMSVTSSGTVAGFTETPASQSSSFLNESGPVWNLAKGGCCGG